MADRRTRKRLATRQSISDAATRLFFAHGFDRVTIDEIAEAADVGRMTVFNHFPRKEDMFFDREQEIRDLAFDAVRRRKDGVSPTDALRRLAHHLVATSHPIVPLFEGTYRFVETAMASEALKARARQMRDYVTHALAGVLAEAAGQPAHDPQAHLAAALISAVWSVAFSEAQTVFGRTRDPDAAMSCFLGLIDQGATGIAAALSGTDYV